MYSLPLLKVLGIAHSAWYARRAETRNPRGRKPTAVPACRALGNDCRAGQRPSLVGVIARRHGLAVSNKLVYRVYKAEGLLRKPQVRQAALYQAAKLFELLPAGPNELWQADVTYLHIPGHAGGMR